MAKAYGVLLQMPDGTERLATADEIAEMERHRAVLRAVQKAWDELYELALAGDLDRWCEERGE